jgi:hypothetical protein
MVRQISLRQFNAFCYVRDPLLHLYFNEVAWFEANGRSLLAVVVEDPIDREYSYLMFTRDERKVFQGVKTAGQFFRTLRRAKAECRLALENFENEHEQPSYRKGVKQVKPDEFLVPLVKDEKLHPYFKILLTEGGYSSAKELINEIVYSHSDIDGNYVKDFQTTGFDGRLWELFLHMFLLNSKFELNHSYNAPDFLAKYFDVEIAIEAVIVNKSESFDEPYPDSAEKVFLLSRDYMPIKFGSSLTSKLARRYWEKEHVKGKPFILAIHDFHMPASTDNFGSMIWTRTALSDYLYGLRVKSRIDESGKLIQETRITPQRVEPINEKIDFHQWKNKSIPSGFFNLPDSENVSAVLFANNATIATFNRMGRMAGLGNKDVKMIRTSTLYNPDPHASEPYLVRIDIDDPDYEEAWGDGMMLYHNPNAKHPVDTNCFPDISHTFLDKDAEMLYGITKPFMPFASITEIIIKDPKLIEDDHTILLGPETIAKNS